MVIDHTGEVLRTQGCGFEATVKLKSMGEAENKEVVEKRGKVMPYRKHEGMRLQPHGK